MIAQFCEQDHRTWDENLPEFATAINSSHHESTGFTPAYLNLGRELLLPGKFQRNTQPGNGETLANAPPIPPVHLERLDRLHAPIIGRVIFRVGDLVMRRGHPLSSGPKGFVAKLAPRFSDPWTISKRASPQVYELKGKHDRVLSHIHIKDLKPPYN